MRSSVFALVLLMATGANSGDGLRADPLPSPLFSQSSQSSSVSPSIPPNGPGVPPNGAGGNMAAGNGPAWIPAGEFQSTLTTPSGPVTAGPVAAGYSPAVAPDLNLPGCGVTPSGCGTGWADKEWHWMDSLELFGGLEGSKQPQDFGVNAHFGGRLSVNWALPLVEDWGLGLQAGTAVNMTKHAVAVTQAVEGASSRTQSFTTLGLFQRTESGWTWGVANDFLFQDDYDRSTLMQLRARLGYSLTPCDEVGVFGMLPVKGDDARWGPVAVRLDPLTQGSVYWRHSWESGGETTGWLGLADRHGQANAALGDEPLTGTVIVFGSDLHVPLNSHFAIFGEANFVTPSDTGTVDAFLGIAFYPGGGASGWRKRAWSPALAVANNTSFTTNLNR